MRYFFVFTLVFSISTVYAQTTNDISWLFLFDNHCNGSVEKTEIQESWFTTSDTSENQKPNMVKKYGIKYDSLNQPSLIYNNSDNKKMSSWQIKPIYTYDIFHENSRLNHALSYIIDKGRHNLSSNMLLQYDKKTQKVKKIIRYNSSNIIINVLEFSYASDTTIVRLSTFDPVSEQLQYYSSVWKVVFKDQYVTYFSEYFGEYLVFEMTYNYSGFDTHNNWTEYSGTLYGVWDGTEYRGKVKGKRKIQYR
jgi:hypothetical protein